MARLTKITNIIDKYTDAQIENDLVEAFSQSRWDGIARFQNLVEILCDGLPHDELSPYASLHWDRLSVEDKEFAKEILTKTQHAFEALGKLPRSRREEVNNKIRNRLNGGRK